MVAIEFSAQEHDGKDSSDDWNTTSQHDVDGLIDEGQTEELKSTSADIATSWNVWDKPVDLGSEPLLFGVFELPSIVSLEFGVEVKEKVKSA